MLKKIPQKHRGATKTALRAIAALGPIGAFSSVADIAAIATVWGSCLYSVAAKENCHLDKDTAVGICKSALLGLSGYYVGCKTATKFFWLIPGAGIFMAMGLSTLTNIIFTYRFVLTLCNIFTEKKNKVNIDNLADNIKAMFKGNGPLNDVKDIVDIFIHGDSSKKSF